MESDRPHIVMNMTHGAYAVKGMGKLLLLEETVLPRRYYASVQSGAS